MHNSIPKHPTKNTKQVLLERYLRALSAPGAEYFPEIAYGYMPPDFSSKAALSLKKEYCDRLLPQQT